MQRTLILVLTGLLTAPVHLSAQRSQEGVVRLGNDSTVRVPALGKTPSESVLIEALDRNPFWYQMDEIARFTQGTGTGDSGSQRAKNPYLAWGLSALFPGFGQFYNGQMGKGVVHFALGFASCVAAAEYRGIPEEVGLAGFWGIWIWSMIDATKSAKAINQGRVQVSVGQANPLPVGSGPSRPFSPDRIEVGLRVRAAAF